MSIKTAVQDATEPADRAGRLIRLPRELWRFLKVQAAMNATTIPAEVERAVEIYQTEIRSSKGKAY